MSAGLQLPVGWRVLVLPGWQNSGPAHWQSRWERLLPSTLQRVEQDDWNWPRRGDWMARLDEALLASEAPAVLVAHSLGCQLAAAWAGHSRHTARVRAALLVAPPDTTRPDTPPQLAGWRNIPRQRLPWAGTTTPLDTAPPCAAPAATPAADSTAAPTVATARAADPDPAPHPAATAVILYSEDDPFCSAERAREMATAWGLPAHNLGLRGHLNADSGLGDWPEGLAHLQRLVEAAQALPAAGTPR